MPNEIQIERLKKVRDYIERHFQEDLQSEQVEEICFYSYRNINRIFKAVYRESIGAYIKRLRIEALAKDILYTDASITEIAFDGGFNDLQAFNKSFKSIYGCSPMQFRKQTEMKERKWFTFNKSRIMKESDKMKYREETIPELHVLYLPFEGEYQVKAIRESWNGLIEYAEKHNLLNDETLYLGEVLDDEEITHPERCRYNCAITIEKELEHDPAGFFGRKSIPEERYAVFTHKGSYESTEETYELIYGKWLLEKPFDLVDKPVLEFYLNDEMDTKEEDLLTEIYIPIEPKVK